MKTTLENIFKGYAKKAIRHHGYSDRWSVAIEGTLKTDTIMELVAKGFEFEVEPSDNRRLIIKIN